MTGPVAAQTVEGGALITVGFRPVFGVVVPDIDPLSGETLEDAVSQTVARLQQALDEAGEARRPGVLVRAVALAIVALAAGVLALWGISRSRRAAAQRLIDLSAKTAARTGVASAEALRASRVLQVERRLVNGIAFILYALILYVVVTFVLRRFPYTRPWGESMRGFLIDTRTITRSQRRARDARVLHGRADPGARQVVHPARRHLLQCGRTRADRCAAVDACRDGTADPPAAHRGDVAVRDRRGLSVPAGQRYGGVPRRQRLRRPDVHAGVGRHRPARHERLHDHLLAGAAGRRLREDRRGRGNGDAPRHPVDQGEDAAARGDHHPERRRHGARRPSTTRGSRRPTA